MKIKNKLEKSQFNEVRKLYTDFFRSINFNGIYNDNMINSFALKKTRNCFVYGRLSQYYFAIENDEIIGLIHGKIFNNIGLICHVYVKETYRNKNVLVNLYRNLVLWFKENNISTIEIEVDKENSIFKNLERYDWQLVRDFEDASVFSRKI